MNIRYDMLDKYCPGNRTQKCPTPGHCEVDCHFNTAELETRKVKPYPNIPKDEFELSDECNSTRRCIAAASVAFLGAIVVTMVVSAVMIISNVM
jgi:hypothetical protein